MFDRNICGNCGYDLSTVPSTEFASVANSPPISPIFSGPQSQAVLPPVESCDHKRYHIAIGILLVALIITSAVFATTVILQTQTAKKTSYSISELDTSSNWSGFIVCCTPGSVSNIVGTWTVPQVSCSATETNSSSVTVWVGIDGARGASNTVEQIGTESTCYPGDPTPTYTAFFEWYPSQAYALRSPRIVMPGDVITADVSAENHNFTASIVDETQRWDYSTMSSQPSAAQTSAEWIVEAPLGSNGTKVSLADFQRVYFSACHATIGGHVGSIGSLPLRQDTMVSTNSSLIAEPVVGFSNDGTNFAVYWVGPGP
jgi:peptidase A4-like protein